MLKAYQREKQQGREHPEWLAWCRSFGNWLLTQEQPGGGFPRSWKPGSGEVIAASPNSSYNAVPLLVLLTETTGDRRHWKRGVSTVGLQLISTGHSLVDAYMAFDADEFAQLAALGGHESAQWHLWIDGGEPCPA